MSQLASIESLITFSKFLLSLCKHYECKGQQEPDSLPDFEYSRNCREIDCKYSQKQCDAE